MSSVATLNQVRFRVRTDTGAVNSTPTWAAAENVAVSYPIETSFCIRFTVNNTGSAAGAGPHILRVSKNSGAYTAVTTSTGATLGAQSEATASSDADETAIPTASFRLTAGTGTALAGVYDETGSATKSITNGFYTELEYGLILKTAGAVGGDTFDFRIYNSTTAYSTYTQTPRITVPVATLSQKHYRIRTDSGAVDATPIWGADEDTTYFPGIETAFRIRFALDNTGTAASTNFILRQTKNSGSATPITTSSTDGIQSASASSDADETAVSTGSFRLTAGTGTAATGGYDNNGTSARTLAGGFYSEHEFGLIFKSANVVAGDYFDFRVYDNTVFFTGAYTNIPRIAIQEIAGSDFAIKTPNLGTSSTYNAAGNASSVVTTTVAQAIGDLVVVMVATDNVRTTDGDDDPVASITDSAGNTYTKAASWSQTAGVAQDGAATALWYSQLTATLAASSSITVTWNDTATRDAVAVGVRSYTVAGGKTVTVEATATGVGGASSPGSLNATTANIECLRIRVLGQESNTVYGMVTRRTANFAAFTEVNANSGTSLTSVNLTGEAQISTGTGAASSPTTSGASGDNASVYVAFRADTAGTPNHACLANDVSSASSVTTAAVQQVHGILANDVASPSSVTQPSAAPPVTFPLGIFRGMHTIEMGIFAANPGAAALLLLDGLGVTATRAYSTRKLRAAHAGSAIRIRRSSDNAETDIGFSGENLDTAAITTFVGANSAYVVTYYDQSGTADNATQATSAQQARIVNAGTLDVRNTKPAPLFDGSDDKYASSSAFTIQTLGVVAAINHAGPNFPTYNGICSSLTLVPILRANSGSNNFLAGSFAISVNAGANLATFGGTLMQINALIAGGTTTSEALLIGQDEGVTGREWPGWIAELIIFATDLSAGNDTAMYNNQKAYWGTP